MSALRKYVLAVFGDAKGYAHLGIGSGAEVNTTGKYRHAKWREVAFSMPEERNRLLSTIRRHTKSDAYLSPYLTTGRDRTKGTAVSRALVHADIDGVVSVQKVQELGGFAVNSGTPGHAHVYVALTESVTAVVHTALCRGLGDYLGDADAKISDNDQLRPPETLNHKAEAFGTGEATPVEFVVEPTGDKMSPSELAIKLNVTLPIVTTSSTGAAPIPVVNIDHSRLPASVRAAVEEITGDRSIDTMRIIAACFDAGHTLAETRAIVNSRDDLAERLHGRTDDDVRVCWDKAVDFRAERRRTDDWEREINSSSPVDIDDQDDQEPVPLMQAPELPVFPIKAMPESIRHMVEEVSAFTQTDPALAGTVALGVLSACAAGRITVAVRGTWIEPVSIYAAVSQASGSRKSPVFAAMMAPVTVAENILIEEWRPVELEARVQQRIAAEVAKQAERAAAKPSAKPEAMMEAISAASELEKIEIPLMPRILADDTTPEALAGILAATGGRVAIASAEGGIFDTFAGRYSNGIPNLDVMLKGYSGEPIRVDRRGAPPMFIERPAVTMMLTLQPSVLSAIARNGAFRGRGLLARFIFAMPPNNVGTRRTGMPPMEPTVVAAYGNTISSMAVDLQKHAEEPVCLSMESGAAAALLAFETALEPRLGPSGDLGAIADWGSKAVGTAVRIAALFHVASNELAVHMPITEDTISKAIEVTEYFAAHSKAAFLSMGADPIVLDAQYVMDYLEREHVTEFTVRGVHTKLGTTRFPKVDDLKAALAVLEEHYWITLLPSTSPSGVGRRPSPRYGFTQFTQCTESTGG